LSGPDSEPDPREPLRADGERRLRAVLDLVATDPRSPTTVRDPDEAWRTHALDSLSGLVVPELAAAIVKSSAKRLITLNLAAEGETGGLSLADHLGALTRYLPDFRADIVLADGDAVDDPEPVASAAHSLGARLALGRVAVGQGVPRHDPAALGRALAPLLGAAGGTHA